MHKHKKRILDANKYLRFVLKDNEKFHAGLLYEDFLKSLELVKYSLPSSFKEGNSVSPLPKGPTTKANTNGKMVRKFPEEKTIKTVHIDYTRKDGVHVEYDRDFNVFKKILQHKYGIRLHFKVNKHGQKVVVSDTLEFNASTENQIKNTHAINLFCEIFNDFEIFTSELEPAIHFNKKFERDLLPSGNLQNASAFEGIVRFAESYTRNPEEHKAFQRRLQVLKDFNPDIRGKGPNDFLGYIVFGFSDLNVVVLETMYEDNATYVFKLEGYEDHIIKDKQSALKDKAFIKRFYHYDNWEKNIGAYLNSLKK